MAARRNAVNTLCRDCGVFTGSAGIAQRCTACGSPRQVRHRDLGALSVAHIDCDAFYAMVEKRDNPGSPTGPAIIGGGRRWGRARLLLCRAAPWGAVGDADVQGSGGLSGRGRDPVQHGEIPIALSSRPPIFGCERVRAK